MSYQECLRYVGNNLISIKVLYYSFENARSSFTNTLHFQPILMAYAKHAGLANPSCQLYMLFYYLGPASVAITLRRSRKITHMKSTQVEYGSISSMADVVLEEFGTAADDRLWPNYSQIRFASFVAIWDIGAQSMVYAGELCSCFLSIRFFWRFGSLKYETCVVILQVIISQDLQYSPSYILV